MKSIGLYIHIPFCDGKCPYCDFYSMKGNSDLKTEYTQKIICELEHKSKEYNKNAKTLYIGGGTPNMLGMDNIVNVIKHAICYFKIPQNAEKTMEINPTRANTMDFVKLKLAGINRISMGLQSSNNKELKILGRKHTRKDVENTVKRIQESGITNISLDLMLGISGQTCDTLRDSIQFCASLDVPHISLYMLKIEPNTKYFKIRESLNLPDDDNVADLYLYACEHLSKLGYNQYEISNFSKPFFSSRHNLIYWNQEEYLGIGPSAHSFIDNKRFFYDRNLTGFLENKNIIKTEEEYSILNGSKEEYIMLKLRLTEGLKFSDYEAKFKEKIPEWWHDKIKKFYDNGFINTDFKTYFGLTSKGFLVSNLIIDELLK